MADVDPIPVLLRARAELLADARAAAIRRVELLRRIKRIEREIVAFGGPEAMPKRQRSEARFRRGELQRIVVSERRMNPAATEHEIAITVLERTAGAAAPADINRMLDRVRRVIKRLGESGRDGSGVR